MPSLDAIEKAANHIGWRCLGVCQQDEDHVVLLGNAGPEWWPIFSASAEARDSDANPMDRFSQRLGDQLAFEFDCQVAYPFGGPPYQPFLKWAAQSGSSFPSVLGPMIHPEYGMWHAYRAALILKLDNPPAAKAGVSPCQTCQDKPCLKTCPVDAIGSGDYDVKACVTHLINNDRQSQCSGKGCLARRSCPIGQDYIYRLEQAGFHMASFVRSNSGKL